MRIVLLMPKVKLNILQTAVDEQRYSCHGCGNCCRDFTVQLRESDLRRLREQKWEEKLGMPPTVAFRGETYLRQREDGSCIFLMENGLCRIHAEYGFEEKPIACQLFPFSLTPARRGAAMGLNFACQSVLENKGADLGSHLDELRRMAKSLPEVKPLEQPPMLTEKLRASHREVDAISARLDGWLQRDDVDLPARLDGLAWIAQSLHKADLENVRDRRLAELLDLLFSALPEELEHLPVAGPGRGQTRLLRQAAFARVEDPKIGRVAKRGRLRTTLGQFFRSRRFARGRGRAPHIGAGWAESIRLQDVEHIDAPSDTATTDAIDDLITRWLRATILGGRAWGAGLYGWPVVDGLKAVTLNIAAVGWLARLHAAGRPDTPGTPGTPGRSGTAGTPGSPGSAPGEEGQHSPSPPGRGVRGEGQHSFNLADVRAALSRVDRTAGRAVWLGTRTERWRLRYLCMDDGLRRLIQRYPLVEPR